MEIIEEYLRAAAIKMINRRKRERGRENVNTKADSLKALENSQKAATDLAADSKGIERFVVWHNKSH